MLMQVGEVKTEEEGRLRLKEAVDSGEAFNRLLKMVEMQGGDISYILHPEKFELAKNIIEIKAEESGYIHKIDALNIGENSMRLGGGRATLEDTIDMAAGIYLRKKVGDYVNKGDVLLEVHTNKPKEVYEEIIEDIKKAYVISGVHCDHIKVIKEIIV